jgi:D-arabinose 1-dehydrogenase-like Zn-dependent alcohol dehydrogenase
MKAAVLLAYDEPPRHDEFPEPDASGAHVIVGVTAAGMNHLSTC